MILTHSVDAAWAMGSAAAVHAWGGALAVAPKRGPPVAGDAGRGGAASVDEDAGEEDVEGEATAAADPGEGARRRERNPSMGDGTTAGRWFAAAASSTLDLL